MKSTMSKMQIDASGCICKICINFDKKKLSDNNTEKMTIATKNGNDISEQHFAMKQLKKKEGKKKELCPPTYCNEI